MHEAGQGQWVLELVSFLLWHLGSGEFSFKIIPLLYLHLPEEMAIISSSALWDPRDTKFANVSTGQPLSLLGHGKNQIICSLRAKQGRAGERAVTHTDLHGIGRSQYILYGELIEKERPWKRKWTLCNSHQLFLHLSCSSLSLERLSPHRDTRSLCCWRPSWKPTAPGITPQGLILLQESGPACGALVCGI